jgi:response regulator RpfG family c-di-GMP phosphodiesterase
MAKNSEDINILIIEDHEDDFKDLKKALVRFGFNVFPENFLPISEQDNIYIKYKEILDNLYKKGIVIHTVFFDLNLKDTDENNKGGSGAELIEKLFNHPLYRYLPKIIFTGIEDFSEINPIVEQEVKIIIQKPSDRTKYYNKLLINKVNITLPVFAELFDNLNNSLDIISRLDKIDYKLDEIKIITMQIVKSLPLLTDKSKAKQIIDNMNNDKEFNKIMKECNIEKPANLFDKLTNLKEKFTENAKENFAEMIYEEVTQFFESEAEIDEDDTKMVQFLKYSTYIVEKVGEAVHRK